MEERDDEPILLERPEVEAQAQAAANALVSMLTGRREDSSDSKQQQQQQQILSLRCRYAFFLASQALALAPGLEAKAGGAGKTSMSTVAARLLALAPGGAEKQSRGRRKQVGIRF